MASTTILNHGGNKEPYVFSLLYFLILLNNLIGAFINLPITLLSCLFIIGIPGVVWIFVYFKRFTDSMKTPLLPAVIILNDVVAFFYNLVIFKIVADNFSILKLDHVSMFPLINLVLLGFNVIMQVTFKIQWKKSISTESKQGTDIISALNHEKIK